MIKILGGILVSLTICIYGFYYSYKESYRQKDLQLLKKSLTIFSSEINYAMSTIEVAAKNISEKTSHPINKIFSDFNKELKENNNSDIYYMWKNSIENNVSSTYFNEEDIREIITFGKTLGYLDHNQQIVNINLLLEYINNAIEEIESTKNQDKKLYQTLSVLGSLLVVIILI